MKNCKKFRDCKAVHTGRAEEKLKLQPSRSGCCARNKMITSIHSFHEFFYGFNSTIAIAAIILYYVYHYYKKKQQSSKEKEDTSFQGVVDSLDDDTLEITVHKLEVIIMDLYEEQERRKQTLID